MLNLKRAEQGLLFLTILFLPTQLGKHFWPEFSYVYSLPIDYLSPTIYFWDILVLALWIIFLKSGKHINRLALSLFYFFILTQALSLLSTKANIGTGLVRLEQYLTAGLFGVYIASQNLKEVKQIIFWGLTASAVGESILAIGQFLKGYTLGFWIFGERSFTLSTPGIAKFDFYGEEFLRPYATFPHPNVLAGFLIITLLILLLVRPKAKRILASLIILLSGLVVLLTVSRVAIVAVVISSAALIKGKKRILIIAGVAILLPVLFTRFSSLMNYDNLTFVRREQLSKTALVLWLKSPILGVGLNNFIPSGANLLLVGPSRFLQPSHNIFLLSLSETGIIGLIGLISLIGYPIFKRRFLIIWGIIILLGLFDHYFLTLPQGYRLLFFVWGLSFCMLE